MDFVGVLKWFGVFLEERGQPYEPLDLERDLPTTEQDVAALRLLRNSRRVSFADYLEFLSSLEPRPLDARAKTHRGHEPFELQPATSTSCGAYSARSVSMGSSSVARRAGT